MKFIFAGTGSAFTMKNYQTNVIIQQNNKNLLIDAGMDVRFALRDIKLSHKDIDAVYVTHLHADHVGGLEWLAFITYFDPSVTSKLSLIGNNELLRDLWEHTLKGGLRSIQGKKMTLNDYFDVQMIKKNGGFLWQDIGFRIVQSVHIMDEYSIVLSFGLMIVDPETGKKIFFTGDTQFNPNQIIDFYRSADVIIQDCETSPFKSGVHANWVELITLPNDVKEKMWLIHYQDNILDISGNKISKEWSDNAKVQGFKGFIEKGAVMDFGLVSVDENGKPLL